MASSLQRAIGEVLAEGLSDPRVRGMVSVTGVKVSSDLHFADVSVSVLPEGATGLTVVGLISAAGHVRERVSERLRARHLPRLRFHADETLKKEAKVFDAIRRGVEEAERRGGTESKEADA